MVKKRLSDKRMPRQDLVIENQQSLVANVKRNWFIYLFLIVITVTVYSRVTSFEFAGYDDNVYVTDNGHVKTGLTPANMRWALTAVPNGDWIPLTWVSLMLDHQMSRAAHSEDPAVYHRTNLILHVLNTLLLFGVLSALTGCRWRSAAVALLFAAHPLHVESVAWVAERKGLLSAFFMMLALWAYLRYVAKPGIRRYLVVASLFALGLMSKSMLMTLPLVLLLLDFWPLRRVAGWTGDKKLAGRTWSRLVVEKLPLLVMSAAICVAASVAQKHGHALRSLAEFPPGVRIANALVSYMAYIWKMIWPVSLACIYPHPGCSIPVWRVIGSGVLLVAITVVAIRAARRRPYLTVGWLWYVITLVPVIGIVQFGLHAMADRFTYVALTGIFIIVVWGVCELIPDGRARVPLLAVLAVAVVVPLSVRAYRQTLFWHDGIRLFNHAVAVTSDNQLANDYLASRLLDAGLTDSAIAHLREVVRTKPDNADYRHHLGFAYFQRGILDGAREQFMEAVRLNPKEATYHNNLGMVFSRQGKADQARKEFLKALRLDPKRADTMCNLAVTAMDEGNLNEALRYIGKAHRAAPENEQYAGMLQDAQAMSRRRESSGKARTP